MAEDKIPSPNRGPPTLQMGDHVYQWCSLAGIPRVFQHHAVVLGVEFRRDNTENDKDGEWIAKIADFSNEITGSSSTLLHQVGCVRVYETPINTSCRWHRVQYQASAWQRHTWRAGTCTAVPSDAPGIVRARVQFLLEHPTILPDYDAVQSNCECVAVWCKTGQWATLQAASWLGVATAGQVKSAVTLAGAAASAQITVPSAGIWGWMGYTTHVSLLSTQPLILPAIVAYGAVTAGVPAVVLACAKKKWSGITETLNTTFWEEAASNPEVFAECLTHWSAQHEAVSDGEERELIPDETLASVGCQEGSNSPVRTAEVTPLRIEANPVNDEQSSTIPVQICCAEDNTDSLLPTQSGCLKSSDDSSVAGSSPESHEGKQNDAPGDTDCFQETSNTESLGVSEDEGHTSPSHVVVGPEDKLESEHTLNPRQEQSTSDQLVES